MNSLMQLNPSLQLHLKLIRHLRITENTGGSVSDLVTTIVAEQKEKDKRQLNVIVHNMTELQGEDPSVKKTNDINEATSLFKEYLGVETTLTNAVRIGKNATKPQLLKVTLQSLNYKVSVLQNKLKLRKTKTPTTSSLFLSHRITHQ